MKKLITAALLMVTVGTVDGAVRQTATQQQTDADIILQVELSILKNLLFLQASPGTNQVPIEIAQRSLKILQQIKRTQLPLIAPVVVLPPPLYTEREQILKLQASADSMAEMKVQPPQTHL